MKSTALKSIAFVLCFAAGLYSCHSPEKKPAATADSKPSDSAATTPDSAVAQSKIRQSPIEFFLDKERFSVPPYGLEKVKTLTTRVKWFENDGGEGGIDSLDEKAYDSLSFREKFTYHMVHPESYSQMCDALPEHPDEATRIYGFLPNLFGEYDWSERQLAFFKDNRDSVDALMKELINKDGRIGENFREAIVEMNATAMIPFLTDLCKTETKDHYSLTVLMLLMNKNKYPEFLNSSSYKKLYAQDHDGRAAFLVYNKANEDLIIQRATNFYNGLAAK